MLKKMLIPLFLCLAFNCFAERASAPKAYDLSEILQIKDQYQKEKELLAYIKVVAKLPVDSFKIAQNKIHQEFLKYNYENAAAVDYYIESIYQHHNGNNTEAENDIVKATELLSKDDYYLQYVFQSNLAFIQTEDGNAIGAISSFRAAKKQAVMLNDGYFQVVVDINISDIYYRYGFYSQSLYFLNQAQLIIAGRKVEQPRIKNIIYYNKCENYFRMGKLDSLKQYNAILKQSKDNLHNLYTYIKRTDYYISLLQREYSGTINMISKLETDTAYKFSDVDRQNLADAWFQIGRLDSAKNMLNLLLSEKAQNNHPEIKYHLYEVLGKIAEKQNDPKQAALNFKLGLEQSKENVNKLVLVGDISSKMKIDEMENYYAQQDEIYRTQNLWMKLLAVVAVLTIAVIAMFYRNAKQKRHYEKLLFAAKKEELAYINSHDIRRHLTNILGIIDVVQHSEHKEKEYFQAEEYLFRSAEELDKAIKNISEKLDN
ncbi:MAG: hypothetical protein ACTHNW_10130 [Mucilaginibacter sp.]